MFNSKKGYVGNKMSVRATEAYEYGLIPFSKITKNDLMEHNIKISLSFLKFLIKNNHIKSAEWHHTGSYFNETNFYSMESIEEQLKDLDLDLLNCSYKDEKKQNEKISKDDIEIVIAKWVQFSGKGRSLKKEHYEEVGVLYKDWIYITDTFKKKACGNHIEYKTLESLNWIEKSNRIQQILYKLKVIDEITTINEDYHIESMEEVEEKIKYEEEKKREKQKKEQAEKKEKEKLEKDRLKQIKKIEKETKEKNDFSVIKINNLYKKIVLLEGYSDFKREDMPLNLFDAKELFENCKKEAEKLILLKNIEFIYKNIKAISGYSDFKREDMPEAIEQCELLEAFCKKSKSIEYIYDSLLKIGYSDLNINDLGNKYNANIIYPDLKRKMETWKHRKTLDTIKNFQIKLRDYGINRSLIEMPENTSTVRQEIYLIERELNNEKIV